MKFKILLIGFLGLLTVYVQAQTNYLVVDKDIRLPKDSIKQIKLINSLNEFLYVIKEGKGVDDWVLQKERLETQILIDEIKAITVNDTIQTNPYLINLDFSGNKGAYLVQIAYVSLVNSRAILKAIFEFISYEEDNKYTFTSPLLRNTAEWKTKTEGHLVFHYHNPIAENVIGQYIKIVNN